MSSPSKTEAGAQPGSPKNPDTKEQAGEYTLLEHTDNALVIKVEGKRPAVYAYGYGFDRRPQPVLISQEGILPPRYMQPEQVEAFITIVRRDFSDSPVAGSIEAAAENVLEYHRRKSENDVSIAVYGVERAEESLVRAMEELVISRRGLDDIQRIQALFADTAPTSPTSDTHPH
jgi:hypothetical protein